MVAMQTVYWFGWKYNEIEKFMEHQNQPLHAGKKYKKLILALLTAALSAMCLVSVTYAWFFRQRQLETLTWIKTPVVLDIGSGNHHDIKYLDMGSIDAENTTDNERLYVFCVYGQPVDTYSLQLAYTTNIPFYYDVYRAKLLPDTTAQAGDDSKNETVEFTYTYIDEKEGVKTETERFQYNTKSTPVISAKPLYAMGSDEISAHQSHNLSYGDDKGEKAVEPQKVQSNAEPLYWLAQENGLSMLNPENIYASNGISYFCDYFVIKVHWKDNTAKNNKETDMVYLTASR